MRFPEAILQQQKFLTDLEQFTGKHLLPSDYDWIVRNARDHNVNIHFNAQQNRLLYIIVGSVPLFIDTEYFRTVEAQIEVLMVQQFEQQAAHLEEAANEIP